jgi:alpha-tubulin suppressor-like RCC1 family protein
MATTTNFKNSSGSDLGSVLVEKSYLIDRYPELADTFKQAGLWVWGSNTAEDAVTVVGQLGDNTQTLAKSSPIQTVAGGTNWKQVSGGGFHTLAIKTDGTLWTWGFNNNGQVGDNIAGQPLSSPVQTVSGGTNWKQVSGGGRHSAAIKTDGTLWLWGSNKYFDDIADSGQLGNNLQNSRSSPVQTVAGGTNWKQVSGGGYHTACIKTDGTLWLWGNNSDGELGNNTRTRKSSPIQTVAGGTNWKQVGCGYYFTAAIKTDGTLWTWGYNSNGQLGDNTTGGGVPTDNSKSSPIQTVAGGTNWKQVACGASHTSAIKADGTLWTWGYNNGVELGDNTSADKSSPVQTVAGGTNWKQVSGGGYHTSAIKTDGTLWLWGSNGGRQLGDNTETSKSSPIQTVAAGTNWKQVACGQYHTACIRDDSADVFGDST